MALSKKVCRAELSAVDKIALNKRREDLRAEQTVQKRDALNARQNAYRQVITPPEVANTGPGANRGSGGGGARGCGFEERVGVHARTGGIRFLWLFCVSCH